MISSAVLPAPVHTRTPCEGGAAEVCLNSKMPRPVMQHRDGASRTIAQSREVKPMRLMVTPSSAEKDITYPDGEPRSVRDAYDKQQQGGGSR